MDSVTVLQMAEFQQVVDSLHRQVVPPPPPPPPYPHPPPPDLMDPELEQIFCGSGAAAGFPDRRVVPHTFQAGPARLEPGLAKPGCHSLPNNVIIRPNIVDKIEQKYINQR